MLSWVRMGKAFLPIGGSIRVLLIFCWNRCEKLTGNKALNYKLRSCATRPNSTPTDARRCLEMVAIFRFFFLIGWLAHFVLQTKRWWIESERCEVVSRSSFLSNFAIVIAAGSTESRAECCGKLQIGNWYLRCLHTQPHTVRHWLIVCYRSVDGFRSILLVNQQHRNLSLRTE